MLRGVFVTGTDTGVGKTVVAGGLAGAWQGMGYDVGVMKPVATGGILINGELTSPDLTFMQTALGKPLNDRKSLMMPYCLKTPAAPVVAGMIEGVEIVPQNICQAYKTLAKQHELMVVEGIGGLLVPITWDYLVIDLVRDLHLPMVIVSSSRLGTINHTMLTIGYAQSRGIEVLGIVVNMTSVKDSAATIAEQTVAEVLKKITPVPVLGVIPWDDSIDVEAGRCGNAVEMIRRHVPIMPR